MVYMRWSYQKRMNSGEFNCCAPAYGFDLIDGELVINETEAAVIRRIFNLYLQGVGMQKIANLLNADEVSRRYGQEKWYHTTVNYVLNKCAALQKDPNIPCHPLNETCRKLFDCAKSAAPIEFDLAEAVITSDITPCITDFIRRGFVFKDSSNVYRNSILQENARRAKISTENYISLPTFNLNMKVSDWGGRFAKLKN